MAQPRDWPPQTRTPRPKPPHRGRQCQERHQRKTTEDTRGQQLSRGPPSPRTSAEARTCAGVLPSPASVQAAQASTATHTGGRGRVGLCCSPHPVASHTQCPRTPTELRANRFGLLLLHATCTPACPGSLPYTHREYRRAPSPAPTTPDRLSELHWCPQSRGQPPLGSGSKALSSRHQLSCKQLLAEPQHGWERPTRL